MLSGVILSYSLHTPVERGWKFQCKEAQSRDFSATSVQFCSPNETQEDNQVPLPSLTPVTTGSGCRTSILHISSAPGLLFATLKAAPHPQPARSHMLKEPQAHSFTPEPLDGQHVKEEK